MDLSIWLSGVEVCSLKWFDSRADWDTAKAICEGLSAHLVYDKNDEIHQFLKAAAAEGGKSQKNTENHDNKDRGGP